MLTDALVHVACNSRRDVTITEKVTEIVVRVNNPEGLIYNVFC